MALKIGVHAGPQNLAMDELVRLWRRCDDAGFHWISVWDHFYANPLKSRNDTCFEAVSAMTALAVLTRNVQVGCLVFCSLFRHPAVLAKAAVTIDHLSGGRANIGVGAGWFKEEFEEHGYPFPSVGKRLDQLEEGVTIMRSLWRDAVTNFSGEHYALRGAVGTPKPLSGDIKLWIGGFGPERTPRLAARYADGFSLPYMSPELVADRLQRLRSACEHIGREPNALDSSVNVGFFMGADTARDVPPGGALVGSPQRVIDRIGEYERAGIRGLNIGIRAPIDWDALEEFIQVVLPAFHASPSGVAPALR
jgi:alkanesulfonate monooxygenase SsuD/methylene tetrahydromethanopterin reductase-like flavin-dependent oxidoreductase (luciferase family)